jgi:hypothetical protein
MLIALVAVSALVAIMFSAGAWSLLPHDSHSSDRLARVVLCLNSASALLFLLTLLSSERIEQISISRISVPNFWLCICITVLSLIKMKRRLYVPVFVSSSILSAGWLIIGGMH